EEHGGSIPLPEERRQRNYPLAHKINLGSGPLAKLIADETSGQSRQFATRTPDERRGRTMVRILCRGRLLAALAIAIGSIIAGWTPATAATPPSFLSIGVPWGSPIRSLDQLQGKRIGVSSAGSLTDWLAKDLARKKGWRPQAITVVTMGNAPTAIIAAFREHLVDAYVNVTSLFLAVEENKTGRVLAPVSQ